MDELTEVVKSGVSASNPTQAAIEKLISEQISDRTDSVYKLFKKEISIRNDIKRLDNELIKAKESLAKVSRTIEKARAGDFSFIDEQKKNERPVEQQS